MELENFLRAHLSAHTRSLSQNAWAGVGPVGKFAVIACRPIDEAVPKVFRNFDARGERADDVSLLEALRATSAAPTYFEGISINGVMHIDGGLGTVLVLALSGNLLYGCSCKQSFA